MEEMGTGISEFLMLMGILLGYGILEGFIQVLTLYSESKARVIKEYEDKLGLKGLSKDFRYLRLQVIVSNLMEVLAFGIVLGTYWFGNQGLFVMMVELGIGLYLIELWLIQKTMGKDLEWISRRVVASKVFKEYANPQLLGKLEEVLTTKRGELKDDELRVYLRNMVKFRNSKVKDELNYILMRYENKERMISINRILLAERELLVQADKSEGSKEGLYKVFKEMNNYILEIPVVKETLLKEERANLKTLEEAEKGLKKSTEWLTSSKFYN